MMRGRPVPVCKQGEWVQTGANVRFQKFFDAAGGLCRKILDRRRKKATLEVGEHELALFIDCREVYRFRWSSVERIDTYKRDLGVVDLICLDFHIADRQLVCIAHDEMGEFDRLCARLEKLFPTISPGWWSEVAFPAFATNHKTLYERSQT
jgi:hypothetical protein